jgi:Methylamine utilisation protein MauE
LSISLLLARYLLALVFVVAAASKLADREALRETLVEFGLPGRAAVAGGLALPFAELAIAGLLIPSGTARSGAVAALVLLAVFCIAIARAIWRGERPDCGCFGARSAPVGPRTLARNAVFATLAGLIAAGPRESLGVALAGVDVTPVRIAFTVLSIVVVVQGWLGWQLLRRHGGLIDRVRALEEPAENRPTQVHEPSGLQIGGPAPPFELSDLLGRRRTLADLLVPGLPVALVFSDPSCGACTELSQHLAQLRAARDGALEIVVISGGSAWQSGVDPEFVLLEQGQAVFEDYSIRAVPSATIVDARGRIASATVTGESAIHDLLASTAAPERLRVAAG